MLTRRLDKRLLVWLIAALISGSALVGVVHAQGIVVVTPTPNVATAAASVANAAAGAAASVTNTAVNLWDQLLRVPQSDLARVILIVGGVVLLVAGWLVYEWIILIAGFLIGAMTALALVSTPNAGIALLAFLIGGLIGAALGALLYYVAVFLIGGYVGIAVTEGLAAALGLLPVTAVAVLVGFIVGGVVLLLLSLELLIIFSAIVGAQMLALALNLGVGWMLVLALIGIVVQIMAVRTRGVEFRRRPLHRTIWVRREVID